MSLHAHRIIELLSLRPHPEGGHYAEIFRSPMEVQSEHHHGRRAASTAIYFLLQASEFSALHRVRSDEVWHHYAGDTLELVLIDGSRSERVRLGSRLELGERPQYVVRANVFQAARPIDGGPHGYTLCGCTVAPGFEFGDFELPRRSELLAQLPAQRELVVEFTREDAESGS